MGLSWLKPSAALLLGAALMGAGFPEPDAKRMVGTWVLTDNDNVPFNLILRHDGSSLTVTGKQRPETPVLISRIHTSSSHHAPLQCSDSAQTGSPPEITPSKDSWSRDPWQLNWVILKPQRTDRRYAQSPPRCPPVLHTEGQRKQASRKARRGRY